MTIVYPRDYLSKSVGTTVTQKPALSTKNHLQMRNVYTWWFWLRTVFTITYDTGRFFFSHRLKAANAEIAKNNPQEGKVNNVTNLLAITEILADDSATDSRKTRSLKFVFARIIDNKTFYQQGWSSWSEVEKIIKKTSGFTEQKDNLALYAPPSL